MAFPTTGILDDFAGTLSNWTTPIFGDGTLTITTGQLSFGGAGYASGVWTAAFGPDMEVYVDVATAGVDVNLFIRTQNTSSSNTNYSVSWQAAGTYNVDRHLSGVGVTILAGSRTFAACDSLGMAMVGTVLTLYRKPSAGAWTAINSVTDAGITGAGQIGAAVHGTTQRLDNFGGGTIPGGPFAAGVIPPAHFGPF